MMRRAVLSCLALLLAGCAANPRSAPPLAPLVASIPPAPPRGEPSQYLNLVASGLEAMLGRPAFVRQDGATQMWRYDGVACRAFFFLYGQPLSVRHVETLPHGTDSAADPGCLAALRTAPPKTS